MAKKKTSDLAAGLFVLVGLGGLLVTIIWVGASGLLNPPSSQASFYWNTHDGPLWLAEGYKVVEGDVEVGTIDGVSFGSSPEGKPCVIYKVGFHPKGFQLRDGAEVKVVASGLLGQPALAVLDRGDPNGKPLDVNVPVALEPDDMAAVMSNMKTISDTLVQETTRADRTSMLAKVHVLLNELNEGVGSLCDIMSALKPQLDPNKPDTLACNVKVTSADLRDAMADVRTVAGVLVAQMDGKDPKSLLAKVQTIANNLSDATGDLKTYMNDDIKKLLTGASEVMDSIQVTAKHLQETTDKINQLVTVNYDGLDEMMDNMLYVSASLKAASEEIRRNPWRLLYRPEKGEVETADLRESARAFEQGASQLNAALTKLSAVAKLSADDPATKKEFRRIREKLEESFQNFRKVEDALWKQISGVEKKK